MPDAEFASSVVAAAAEGQQFATGAFSFRHHLREANVVSYFSDAVSAAAAIAFVAITVAAVPSAANDDANRADAQVPHFHGAVHEVRKAADLPQMRPLGPLGPL